MAKGKPPPAFLRGKGAAPPMAGRGRPPPPMPPRRAPPAGPPMMEPDADDMGGAAYRKGGKVGGQFPMGKKVR